MKDASFFDSVGRFVFTFTTPVAIIALSFIVLRIVSERHEAIQSTLRLKSELLEATETLNRRLDLELAKAKEKLLENERYRLLTEVALAVSHDIRSPVAALGVVESQLSPDFPQDQRELMRHAIRRIKNIADNLLDSSRQQARNQDHLKDTLSEHTREPAAVGRVVQELIHEKQVELSKRYGLKIEFECPSEIENLRLPLDCTHFGRILSNLINNAAEAIDGAGLISVRVDQTAHQELTVTVSDNGKGIPPHILEKLRREAFSHGKPEGSGIGLQSARAAMESISGSLTLNSDFGEGTEVILTFPVATLSSPESAASSGPAGE
jgi:hypothetical protein